MPKVCLNITAVNGNRDRYLNLMPKVLKALKLLQFYMHCTIIQGKNYGPVETQSKGD